MHADTDTHANGTAKLNI